MAIQFFSDRCTKFYWSTRICPLARVTIYRKCTDMSTLPGLRGNFSTDIAIFTHWNVNYLQAKYVIFTAVKSPIQCKYYSIKHEGGLRLSSLLFHVVFKRIWRCIISYFSFVYIEGIGFVQVEKFDPSPLNNQKKHQNSYLDIFTSRYMQYDYFPWKKC